MPTAPAEEFSQLTWTIMLAVPALVTLLHAPLLVEWLLDSGQMRHAEGSAVHSRPRAHPARAR